MVNRDIQEVLEECRQLQEESEQKNLEERDIKDPEKIAWNKKVLAIAREVTERLIEVIEDGRISIQEIVSQLGVPDFADKLAEKIKTYKDKVEKDGDNFGEKKGKEMDRDKAAELILINILLFKSDYEKLAAILK